MTKSEILQKIIDQPDGTKFLVIAAKPDHSPMFLSNASFESILSFISYASVWIEHTLRQQLLAQIANQEDTEGKG